MNDVPSPRGAELRLIAALAALAAGVAAWVIVLVLLTDVV